MDNDFDGFKTLVKFEAGSNNTIINGGTFNGDIYTSPKDMMKKGAATTQGEKDKAVLTELLGENAERLWKIAKDKGWVDDNLQPRISQPKAAIMASVMADKLELSPRWTAFERHWGIEDLGNKLSRAQDGKYYYDFLKEVENAMD